MNDTETLSPVLPDALEEATRRLLGKACERELVLATAESCTGGMLASLLTARFAGAAIRLTSRARPTSLRNRNIELVRPVAGKSNARTLGSTALGGCSLAGKRKLRIT